MKTLSILVPVLFIAMSATAQRTAQPAGGSATMSGNTMGSATPQNGAMTQTAPNHATMATGSTPTTPAAAAPETQQTASSINPGDCVQARSGQAVMTVIKIDPKTKTCTCSWSDKTSNLNKQGKFDIRQLIKTNCDNSNK